MTKKCSGLTIVELLVAAPAIAPQERRQARKAFTLIELLAVPGVARMISPPGMRRLLRHDGVEIEVIGNSVHIKLHVVAEPHVNMLSIGRQIQTEVARAVQDMVGMEVRSIDVHIEDVTYPSEGA